MADRPEPDWADARTRFETGDSLREIAQATGIGRELIRRTAKREQWERHQEPAGTAQTQAARDRAATRWDNRRAQEADAAGLTAGVARQRITKALAEGDDKMTRAAAIAYGILIDKAQLLSGSATSRLEQLLGGEGTDDRLDRRAAELDELARKRAQKGA